MKTLNQKNPLAFHKNALVELNSQELRTTDSGILFLISSVACGLALYAMSDDIADGWNAYGG